MASEAPTAIPASGALGLARLIAFALPAGLLVGAYGFQHIGGLPPCEMCYWQRWAHMAALGFAVASFAGAARLPDKGRAFVWLAALAILASGGIGAYHAGVEAGLLTGFTQCTASLGGGSSEDLLKQILAAPVIRCDQVPWSLLGISMAGWNAILSILGALTVLWLSLKRNPVRP